MPDVWLLIEYQERRRERHFTMGVFSSPELAVRWLRRTSARWMTPVRTGGFRRHSDDCWVLDDAANEATYSVTRWTVDEPVDIVRVSVEGATAALEG